MDLLLNNQSYVIDPNTQKSYQVIKHIANGGFSQIYLVKASDTDQLQVLKIITSDDDSQKNVIRDEIRIFNMLKRAVDPAQDYLIKYYANFECLIGQKTYLCMILEYFDGISLREYLDQNILLTPSKAKLIVQQIASVLLFFHQNTPQLIHRDLKPENILVNHSLTKIKIIDYGASSVVFDTKTLTSDDELKCTILYASPKLVKVNHKQQPLELFNPNYDLHSLAVLYYELLTGTDPLDYNRFKNYPKQDVAYLKSWWRFDSLSAASINPLIKKDIDLLIHQLLNNYRNKTNQQINTQQVYEHLTNKQTEQLNTQTSQNDELILYNDLRSLNKIKTTDQPWFTHLIILICCLIFTGLVLLAFILVWFI
ncbi:serine/threonine-protein kinase [Ureaplasma zalophigenitalium]|uniref:Serine/threonine protein kinase n=1 Tax=Ureaplasma zalophigenitalium TaxID=907723 RepID=A0ABT3BP10_9BACT|nr:serine/threonine-protein kinase [Ureaplasma zalophigenitalium]MCV3754001.1 serine/threonine protein kinase [Ureaplasma zalophigenitalium]